MIAMFPPEARTAGAALNNWELKELFWQAIPRKWQIRLTDKLVKRHLITKNEFINKLDTIQLVKQQERFTNTRQNAKSQLSYGKKGLQSSAGAKRKSNTIKTSKFKKLHGTAPDAEHKHFCLCHGWNHTHVSDKCKILMAEANKLKRLHEAGLKESRVKFKESYKNFNKKDLHALIDERIGESQKNGKNLTFATLKDAKKYLKKHADEIDSDSDDE